MNPARLRILARLPGLRPLAWKLPLAGALLSVGCTHTEALTSPTVTRGAAPADVAPPAPLHPPLKGVPSDQLPATVYGKKRVMPLALDTVLRVAEEQNTQVALAREKLNESEVEKRLADLSWLPDIHAGVAWYRHEGGIQNEDGTLTKSSFGTLFPGVDLAAKLDLRESMYQRISAERKVWQQHSELSRVASEQLLEAANTYIDLLAARTIEALFKQLEFRENDALKFAEALFKSDKSAEVVVEAARAQLAARKLALSQARVQGDSAAVKLAYLLGLGPDVELVPVESALKPIDLVNAAQPTETLVAQALSAGPGVRELEQMVGVIQDGIARASGPGRFIPVLEMRMCEGAFGAGPNDTLDWTNRWDVGVQMRWNLTGLLTGRHKSDLAHSRLQQAELGYRDLRGRLTLGVQEAQQTVHGSAEQIRFGASQVQHADKSYKVSDLRLKGRVEGSTTAEVLAALRGLEMAHLSSLSAIRAHNKAQVRLMILTGAAGVCEPHKK